MVSTALDGLRDGFAIALEPSNFLWCFVGVLFGNVVGVLPGMGVLAAISVLLPLTFVMKPVAAVLMLAGIYYGAQYGGAICSILLNLPCHPPHAVTCLDGFPLTRQGRASTALGVTMLASFMGASFGIVEMIFFAPVLVRIAFKFGPAEICSLMLLGLLAGATLAKGSPLKGVAMTVLGLLLGLVGTDINTGEQRFTFGIDDLSDGIDLVALALGVFGVAEFLRNVNAVAPIQVKRGSVRLRAMWLTRSELRRAIPAAVRGMLLGSLCSLIPGTGPTIASFVAYATEKKISRDPSKFGHGAIEGVACPEAATHASVQGDFIPTMSLGIPGDAVMALMLGALIIQGITPGPQLISEHPDVFWGLIASFWIGNILLIVLNVPLIGIWIKMLSIPYRVLYPCALIFICIGVFSTNNELFGVAEVLAIGLIGYVLLQLGFHPAPILLGFVLGPRFEENFRRALLISRGDIRVFVERPISAVFLGLAVVVVVLQMVLWLRRRGGATLVPLPENFVAAGPAAIYEHGDAPPSASGRWGADPAPRMPVVASEGRRRAG